MKYYISEITGEGSKKYAADDIILTKNTKTTAASKMLENYTSLFEAEVITRANAAGYTLVGKTNCGEFGLDTIGETSYFGETADDNGNLVAAAAEAVKNGEVECALTVDSNGAPRRAAMASGVDYLKPTYGVVSRFGFIPCASSGETAGIYGKTAEAIADMLKVIAGKDEKDATTLPKNDYELNVTGEVKGKKFAVVKEYLEYADACANEKISNFVSALKNAGAEVCEISLKETEEIKSAWQIIMCAETCNNLSRYDGVKFGYRTANYKNIEELYTNTRTEAFGLLTKAVILYGSEVLSKGRYEKYYDKALRMRRIAKNILDSTFKEYDALILPAASKAAFRKEDPEKTVRTLFEETMFSALASITGNPAAVAGGVQIIADNLKEDVLLDVISFCDKEA